MRREQLSREPSDLPQQSEKLPPATPANKNASLAGTVPEFTWRAVLAGIVLGAALAAANVYTALKTGYIDGGSITASVLSFAAFRLLSRPYTALENNLTQTIAASAAVMSFVAGVAGPMPALARAGHVLPSWQLCVWSVALGVFGIAIAVALRSRLISAEGLPFPTGTATAEVIAAMTQTEGNALRRARGLLLAAVIAAAIAWLRDGPLALLPQSLDYTGALLGVATTELSIGVSVSPLMFATGLISGLRAGLSMWLGGVIAWCVFAPTLVNTGLVASAERGALTGFLLWPAVALVLSGSLTALALQWRALGRGLLDLRALVSERGAERARRSVLPLVAAVLVSCAALVWIADTRLGIAPVTTLLALTLSAALAVVCARGAGETDIAPCGDMGGLTQLVFGTPANSASSLTCGALATGCATQTAQTLWAFKAGQKLGASSWRQTLAQVLGAVLGALVVVPTADVVMRAYGLGSERLPAIAVMSWEATAAAAQGGLATLPPYAATAALIAFALGALLTLLNKTRVARYLPAPAALGIGFLLPLSMSSTLLLGAIALSVLARRYPDWTREHVESVAGGAIAGESLFAVVFAFLLAF